MYCTDCLKGWVDMRLLSMIGITTPAIHVNEGSREEREEKEGRTTDASARLGNTHRQCSAVVEMLAEDGQGGQVDQTETKAGPDSLCEDSLPELLAKRGHEQPSRGISRAQG